MLAAYWASHSLFRDGCRPDDRDRDGGIRPGRYRKSSYHHQEFSPPRLKVIDRRILPRSRTVNAPSLLLTRGRCAQRLLVIDGRAAVIVLMLTIFAEI